MAIYQFKLNLIPEKGLINHIGIIPHTLKINFEERNEHYYLKEDGLVEDSDFFTYPLTANLWNSSEVIITEIIYYISEAFPEKPQKSINHYHWKDYSRFVDNDASLILDKNNETIEELYFRADLREEGLVFLNKMIT
ncbi:hypothetical protein [Chryseobacterium sp. Hurlbut01]|jgi:hypothetical protein|uniref:hypothetical protein n=1 Tax=Chryseobacterium sp. Hurlbut01 TaxID=1681828 RepID=UPI00067BF7F5|nr:hypothetical protein [Chryseobacterium sp. Hurlbut01]KNB61130.1 hypothetical protein AC804_11070 [Chryseobacterium sp. Hurlbut01]